MDPRRPDFKIYEDGNPIGDDVIARVLSITVDDPLDGSAIAMVKFRDEGSELSDAGKFKIGAEVKIELGYVGQTKQVFMGQVTGWRGAFPRRGNQSLTIVAQDKFHLLRRNKRQKTFLSMKDSEAISQAAQEAGLAMGKCDATPIKQDSIGQWNQTDGDFILERASLFGYEVFTDDKGKLNFQEPKLDDGAAAEIEWHKALKHFSVILSLSKQQKEMKVKAWDMKNKDMLEYSAKKGDERSMMGGTKAGAELVQKMDTEARILDNFPANTPQEVETYAKAIFQKRAEGLLKGEGTCDGNPDIQRGKVVKVMGIGQFLEGPYHVKRAIHTLLEDSGYTTTFRVTRSAVMAPSPPPDNYERPEPPEKEPVEVEPEAEPLKFQVTDPSGAPLGGVPYILQDPDGTREAGDLSSDGTVEIDFQ